MELNKWKVPYSVWKMPLDLLLFYQSCQELETKLVQTDSEEKNNHFNYFRPVNKQLPFNCLKPEHDLVLLFLEADYFLFSTIK